ncbi:MAG: glutathione peroxidase [Lentisphaeria bacterium]|jgi:glutathione peroxidase
MSVSSSHADEAAACPVFLNHDFRQLHSDKTINLCENYSGKPLLIVNTASHCGYTKQFGPLESLHQKYKDQGLHIVGFASDDFNQEDKDEAKAAGICYKNYGVTFTMLAPTQIKGEQANEVFKYLAAKSQQPSWNFNKYLVLDNGNSVEHFGSSTEPLDSALENNILAALK